MSEKINPRCCGRTMAMVENPYVWDGGLYWVCETCERSQHRFPEGDYRRVRGVQQGAFPEGIQEASDVR